ncbi:MAG: HypC/HybG/HupF family hydrogenase formation chaperone [Rhodospirillales bacterium]|nr:HypC/HybG/HupF family hydrogenase formation chaperone [Rhodospirillales bacterium]
MCLAIPAKVVKLLGDGMADIELEGVVKEVSLDLLDGIEVGDYVIIHVGYALARLDPEEAERTLALFAEMGRLAEESAA